MKSIQELKTIHDSFLKHQKLSHQIDKGSNWDITFFNPFERNGEKIYSFRLYGETNGSKHAQYHLCGSVEYSVNLKTKELKRKELEHKLHPVITKRINVAALLKTI
jgi:hypothetical protein